MLDICLDKSVTAKFLSEHGLDAPHTYADKREIPENGERDMGDTQSEIQKRYILKPIKSNGSKNIRLFESVWEIPKEIGSDCILQEYIESAEEYTVGVFRQKETVSVISFLRQLRDGRYYIFEINPRISGTVRFRHMLGFTDVLWWLDLLDGITVDPWKSAYKRAVGIRELNEKFLILE